MNIVKRFLCSVSALVVSFILCLLLWKDEKQAPTSQPIREL